MNKANQEYQRFLIQNPSPVEKTYLQTIKEIEKTAKRKLRKNKNNILVSNPTIVLQLL